MPTYRELKAQAESLLQQAEDLRQKEVSDVIEDIRRKMAEYDIRVDDLRSGRRKPLPLTATGTTRKAPIKYRDSTGNTWSGRGLKPKWLQHAITSGKKVEDFAV